MQLSKNFSLDELAFSPTAAQSGIHNEPGSQEIECLKDLVTNVLQPIRDYFQRPVVILSGFRSAPLNRAVGGAPDSQHMRGQAADIRIIGFGNDMLWQYIHDNLIFDQVILEHVPAKNTQKGWVHVSFKSGVNRKEALSCVAPGDYRDGLVYAGN